MGRWGAANRFHWCCRKLDLPQMTWVTSTGEGPDWASNTDLITPHNTTCKEPWRSFKGPQPRVIFSISLAKSDLETVLFLSQIRTINTRPEVMFDARNQGTAESSSEAGDDVSSSVSSAGTEMNGKVFMRKFRGSIAPENWQELACLPGCRVYIADDWRWNR